MLYELFADAHSGWAQEFLLRTEPLTDLHVFSNQEMLHRGVSCTIRSCADENLSVDTGAMDMMIVGMWIPTHNMDGLIAGIGVDSVSQTDDNGGIMHALSDCVTHFVMNPRTNSSSHISLDYKSGRAQVLFFSNQPGRKLQNVVHFHLDGFLASFERAPHRIDFNRLQQALISSFTSELDTGSPMALAILPKNTGEVFRGENLPLAMKRHIVSGDYYSHNYGTVYSQGIPLQTLKYGQLNSRLNGAYLAAVNSLSSWAITDTVSRMVPVIQAAPVSAPVSAPVVLPDSIEDEQMFSTLSNDSGESARSETQPLIAVAHQAVPIAPLPTVIVQQQVHETRQLTYAEQVDALVNDKKERRKMRNREAAARSYRRRKGTMYKTSDLGN